MRPLLILVLCSATALGADALRFADVEAWSTWDMPYGLVEFGDAGQLQLVKYRKDINAVANAPLFTHGTRSRGEAVAGGIWKAGSNPDAAEQTIDGDPATFWQAAPNDALDDWFVQVNLGRAVLAKEIRLTFPDQESARPFRQFSASSPPPASLPTLSMTSSSTGRSILPPVPTRLLPSRSPYPSTSSIPRRSSIATSTSSPLTSPIFASSSTSTSPSKISIPRVR